MTKLTDLESILLSAAAQRDTGSLLPAPETLSGAGTRLTKAIAGLVKRGLAVERETSDKLAAHRVDGDVAYGLYVTDSGNAAIGIAKVRYRYYVSQSAHHVTGDGRGMRIPAREIETATIEALAAAFDDPMALMARAGIPLELPDMDRIFSTARETAATIRQRDPHILRAIIAGRLTVGVGVGVGSGLLGDPKPTTATSSAGAVPNPPHDASIRAAGTAPAHFIGNGRRAHLSRPDDKLSSRAI